MSPAPESPKPEIIDVEAHVETVQQQQVQPSLGRRINTSEPSSSPQTPPTPSLPPIITNQREDLIAWLNKANTNDEPQGKKVITDPDEFLEMVKGCKNEDGLIVSHGITSDNSVNPLRDRGRVSSRFVQVLADEPDPLKRARCITQGAKIFGVPTGALRDEVNKLMAADAPDDPVVVETEPWDEEVVGAEVLDEIEAKLKQFLVADDEAIWAMSLWSAYTHVFDCFDISPCLTFTSPTKRHGKTTAQVLTSYLAARSLNTSSISASALFRTIEKHRPSLFVDEADTLFELNEELRQIVNAGHFRPNAFVLRSGTKETGYEPVKFSTFGPKSLALIENNEHSLPDTIVDRSIIVSMKRKKSSEKRRRYRRTVLKEFEPLRRKLARWAGDNLEGLKEAHTPRFPIELSDNSRAEDSWEPLLVVSEFVGGRWLERARQAAVKLSGTETRPIEEPESVQLLQDIRSLFYPVEGAVRDKVSSEQIVRHLNGMAERPWSDFNPRRKDEHRGITQRQVAVLLREFRDDHGVPIEPKRVRLGAAVLQGYERWQFEDAWARLCSTSKPAETSTTAPTPLQTAKTEGKNVVDRVVDDVSDGVLTRPKVEMSVCRPFTPEQAAERSHVIKAFQEEGQQP